MKKWLEELLRKVLGEFLSAESISKVLMRVVEKVLKENPEWVKAIAAKVKEISDAEKAKTPDAPPETLQEPEAPENTEAPAAAADGE